MRALMYPGAGTSWFARLLAAIACLVSSCLIGVLLVSVWLLFGRSTDFPPTWYWTLSVVLTAADVAAICYIVLGAVRRLLRRAALMRLARTAVLLVLLLGESHAMALATYFRIPEWDFQSSLFDDLSPPLAGSISSSCAEAQRVDIPFSKLESIARQDYSVRRRMPREEETMARGWHAWIESTSSHSEYDNPDHRIVSLILQDPYSAIPEVDSSPRVLISGYYLTATDVEKLRVGQEVLLCGRISDVSDWITGTLTMDMNGITLNPRAPGDMAAVKDVPPDLLVEYESHGCSGGYSCPDFKVTIEAGGSVTYQGFNGAQSKEGVQHGLATQQRLAELAWVLEKSGYFALNGEPEHIEGEPAGWTVLHVRMDGRTKTMAVPPGSGLWPASLGLQIGKIQEVSRLEQWVTLVR